MGASKLACKYGALSCDHLEYTDEDTVKEMAKSGTVAVLLPGAYYFLRETKMPPIELFRKYWSSYSNSNRPKPWYICSLFFTAYDEYE